MNVLVVEPMKEPYIKDIDSGLESLQREVGGYIQAIYPFEEQVGLVCNEEGKLNGLPLNRALRTDDGHIYDVLAGTFLVVGLGEEDFESLPDDPAAQYKRFFETPEAFVSINGEIIAVPAEVKTDALTIDEWVTTYQSAMNCKRTLTDNFALKRCYKERKIAGFTDHMIDRFGLDSVRYVAAATVNRAGDDQRYSKNVREWAANAEPFPAAPDRTDTRDGLYDLTCNVHPVIMNELAGRIMEKEQTKGKRHPEPVR